jgi:hypothetical protein
LGQNNFPLEKQEISELEAGFNNLKKKILDAKNLDHPVSFKVINRFEIKNFNSIL